MQLKILYAIANKRRFLEILSQGDPFIVPKAPEDAIISRFLLSGRSQKKEEIVQASKAMPLRLANYRQYLQGSPLGSVIQRHYKGIDLSLVSMSYQKVSLQSLYHLMQEVNPDLIFVQTRPEKYLKKFEALPKKEGVFSDREYLQQLKLSPEQTKNLILSRVNRPWLQAALTGGDTGRHYEESYKKSRQSSSIVNEATIDLSALFSEQHNCSILLGEMPEVCYREWVCNRHTLLQLQEIFKAVFRNILNYSWDGMTPYKMATLLYPQVFLNIHDRYMATLIQMLAARGGNRRVLGIFGIVENEAIQQILREGINLQENEGEIDYTPMVEFLVPPGPKSSIIRNIQCWQILEKHIIMDVLDYAEQTAEVNVRLMATTDKIFRHYGSKIGGYSREAMMLFRHDKVMEYIQLLQESKQEGERIKQKMMMREALRQANKGRL